jgi:AcrR family transcriptional regulator
VKRRYDSSLRTEGAEATRHAVLDSACALFSKRGIDRVTIAQVAEKAGVATSTVFALFKSKEGILRALMQASLFGPRFQEAQAMLEGVTDPVEAVARTSGISRAIYESESDQVGLIRGASGFSVSLRRLEEEFEATRLDMQEERLRKLQASGRLKRGISLEEARRIMWMYTSRDVYRMLVHAGGWPPDRYQEWLSQALVSALVE